MQTTPPTAPERAVRRRRRLATIGAISLVVGLYAGALALLSRPSVEAALRARIQAALAPRLGEVTLGPDVHVDPLFRVSFGPLTIPGARPGDPPTVRVDRVKVRARFGALLTGRVEAASVRLYGVRVEAGRSGRAVLELAQRLRGPPAPAAARPAPQAPERGAPAEGGAVDGGPAPRLPTVHVRGLVVAFPLRERAVEIGPADLTISRGGARGGGEWLRAEARLPGDARAEVSLRRDAAGWHGEARLAELPLQAVPAALRGEAAAPTAGVVALRVAGDAAADLLRARGHARLSAREVTLAGERIGAEPLGPLSLEAEGDLAWDGNERRLALSGGTIALPGDVKVAVAGQARLGSGVPFDLSIQAADVDFAAAAAALPQALALPPDAPHPAGTFDVRVALAGPLVAPSAWTVDAALELSRLREAARRAPPVPLRAPFVYRPSVERGAPPALRVGPGAPDFVPIAELPAHVVRAVTASEDAGFFGHDGFDFEELKNALAQGAQRGRLVRGGSTITQQLAKNLYLSREKTFVRKAREAVLTIALEATVPKQRLLEIYLNVAEWGPGVWGIGPAARHWFGVEARDLTPRQAAFLATVIPNPVRYHYLRSRGTTTEGWDQRVNDLLLKLNAQGVLDDEALLAALDETLVFVEPTGVAATP